MCGYAVLKKCRGSQMAPPPDRVAPESPPPDIAPDMAAPGKAPRSPYRSRHWRSSGVKECSFCIDTVGGELLSCYCHIHKRSCAGCTARGCHTHAQFSCKGHVLSGPRQHLCSSTASQTCCHAHVCIASAQRPEHSRSVSGLSHLHGDEDVLARLGGHCHAVVLCDGLVGRRQREAVVLAMQSKHFYLQGM